jgi:hypothetical protein
VGVNNGSLAGNTGFGTGTAGTAFVLDGSGDGVVLSNMPSLRLQDFTIETWIKRGSSTVVSLNHPLYGVLLGYGLGGYGLGLRNDGRLYISKVGASDTGIDNAVTDTNWHHVAVTKLGTNVIFYVDGIAYPTLPYDPGFTFTTPIAIGAQGDTLASSFLGSIDEISVYNRNLSTSEIQAIYNAGSSGKCTTGIPPSISLQPADQNVTVGGTANFSIAASGTQPLAYQWLRNGTSLNGETGASLVLTNAQLSQAGSYSVLVSNVAGSILSSNASLVVSLPPALVRAVGGSITAGAEIILPVKLVANGNENALGFSLSFDASWLTYASASLGSAASSASLLLNTNQVGNGKLGIALALPTEAAFAAGTQDVIHVNFNTEILSGTQSVATAISFVDQPIVKRVVDAQAQALPANYANATVTLIPGDLEADVAARPTGDRVLDIVDWVEVGRFVAGLDVPATGSEFQRADCTPRPALGDGQLKVTDWVQAGRYAAGLDPLTLAGGPTNAAGPALRAQPMRPSEGEEGPAVREVRVSNGTAIHGLTVTVPVMLESLGDENAVGFTLTFDPSVFQYYSASKGSAAASGTLNVNPNVAGKVGVTVALPTSSTFAVGTREVARVTLTAIAPVASDYPIALGDQPVVRAVSDVRANELNATYTAGSVFVNPVPKLDIMRSGQSAVLSWPVWAEGFSVQSRDLLLSRNWTNVSGTVQTNVGNLTLTVPVTGEAKYFRLYHP